MKIKIIAILGLILLIGTKAVLAFDSRKPFFTKNSGLTYGKFCKEYPNQSKDFQKQYRGVYLKNCLKQEQPVGAASKKQQTKATRPSKQDEVKPAKKQPVIKPAQKEPSLTPKKTGIKRPSLVLSSPLLKNRKALFPVGKTRKQAAGGVKTSGLQTDRVAEGSAASSSGVGSPSSAVSAVPSSGLTGSNVAGQSGAFSSAGSGAFQSGGFGAGASSPAMPGPGSGSGSTPRGGRTPTPEMIDQFLASRIQCEDAPRISFTANHAYGDAYPQDRLTVRWEITEADGSAWPEPVRLRSSSGIPEDTSIAARGAGELVSAVDSRTIARAADLEEGPFTYYLNTLCGDESVTVGMTPKPHISSYEPVTCGRTIDLGAALPGIPLPDRECSDLVIRGSGFGSDTLGYRTVSVRTAGLVEELDIVSWSNIEIIARFSGDPLPGTYSLRVEKGTSEYRNRRSDYSSLRVIREDRIDRRAIDIVLDAMFAGATMKLDNLQPRLCDEVIWGPVRPYVWDRDAASDGSGLGGTGLVPRTLEDGTVVDYEYCAETRDTANCEQRTTCTRYQADNSYIEFLDIGSGDTRRETFEILPKVITVDIGVSRWRCRYYLDEINSDSVDGSLDPSGVFRFDVEFESDGTEVKGYSGEDDWNCPDTQLNNMEIHTEFTPALDARGRLTYGDIDVEFDGDIQAGGICDYPTDLCDEFSDYKSEIRDTTRDRLTDYFELGTTRDLFAEEIDNALEPLGIGRIISFRFEPRFLVLENIPR
jgi:hypothetical protein